MIKSAVSEEKAAEDQVEENNRANVPITGNNHHDKSVRTKTVRSKDQNPNKDRSRSKGRSRSAVLNKKDQMHAHSKLVLNSRASSRHNRAMQSVRKVRGNSLINLETILATTATAAQEEIIRINPRKEEVREHDAFYAYSHLLRNRTFFV